MIKINLALKKQAVYADASAKSSLFSGAGSGKEVFTSLFPRMILPVLIALGANYAFDYWVETRTEEMNAEVSVLEGERNKIQAKLRSFSGFEAKKAELNGMLDIFSAKVAVFDALVRSREVPLRALVTLSMACPKEVWFSKISFTDAGVEISGRSTDIALISEVMEKMNVEQVFRDVKLKSTIIEDVTQQTVFELTAGRI
jgi:Tfp pilus assembly protein PilN